MKEDIYRTLQQKIHGYGPGFPPTKSGVELKILKRFFSEEDAEFYLKMAPQPETVEMIASRMGDNVEKTAAQLEHMLRKGTVLCFDKGDVTVYGPAPYMVGLYENAANDMDVEMAKLFEQYHTEAFFEHAGSSSNPVLKYVPVQEALKNFTQVYPHDDVVALLKGKKKIGLIDCVCRKQLKLIGARTRPIEVCFSFDELAEYFVDKRKQGRYLTLDEALEIQRQCEDAGLMSTGGIMKDEKVMCHCDKDCIAIRSVGKRFSADHIVSNYYAQVDADACIGCETCLERCPTETISMSKDEIAEIDLDRCVGCGLCVIKCPTGALSLKQKPEEKQLKELMTLEEVMKRRARK